MERFNKTFPYQFLVHQVLFAIFLSSGFSLSQIPPRFQRQLPNVANGRFGYRSSSSRFEFRPSEAGSSRFLPHKLNPFDNPDIYSNNPTRSSLNFLRDRNPPGFNPQNIRKNFDNFYSGFKINPQTRPSTNRPGFSGSSKDYPIRTGYSRPHNINSGFNNVPQAFDSSRTKYNFGDRSSPSNHRRLNPHDSNLEQKFSFQDQQFKQVKFIPTKQNSDPHRTSPHYPKVSNNFRRVPVENKRGVQLFTNRLYPSLTTQYKNQDLLGRYIFGYQGDTSSRHETRELDGSVRGTFSYLDSNGKLQSQNYLADRNGFRAVGTNIPFKFTKDGTRGKRSVNTKAIDNKLEKGVSTITKRSDDLRLPVNFARGGSSVIGYPRFFGPNYSSSLSPSSEPFSFEKQGREGIQNNPNEFRPYPDYYSTATPEQQFIDTNNSPDSFFVDHYTRAIVPEFGYFVTTVTEPISYSNYGGNGNNGRSFSKVARW